MNNLVDALLTDGHFAGLQTRPARALIGWMAKEEAKILLGIPRNPMAPCPEHVRRVQQAHAAMESRSAGIDQTHAISDLEQEAKDRLAEDLNFKQYIERGRQIKIANLSEICALQPIVHVDYVDQSNGCGELIRQADQADILSLVRITLPPLKPIEPQAQFDKQANAWTFQTRNSDTRVVGPYRSRLELRPGLFGTVYGFCVASLPSLVQVMLYRGRYFLTDGYHRSLALLEKGITHIPVIFGEIPESESLNIEGRFPDETILGPRPPRFSDFLRDDVAAVVSHLALQRTITIQAVESQNWG